MDKAILPNPPVEVMGEKMRAFNRMHKRINQLDGLLTFLHEAHENIGGSHLDYTLELAADTAFEIRELAALIDDSTPPADEIQAMRRSYRETVEAAEALLDALQPLSIGDAAGVAAEELEGHIGAARDDFLGTKEVQS